MIKMMNACTLEVDDGQDALEEILGQLELDKLAKNTVGILTCHYEFVENGIVQKLCESLPFDIIGCTTMASATRGESSMYLLSLAVLTSDDVSFATILTKPLAMEDCAQSLEDAYREARGGLPGEPGFIISLFPFIPALSGAVILNHLDRIGGSIPIWGSMSSDVTANFVHNTVFRNGHNDSQALALLLMHGPVEPEFFVTSLPDRNIRSMKAVITESDGCLLKKANGMTLLEYFESVGLSTKHGVDATNVPLMLDYGDGGKPVALAIYHLDEKDGSALCGGEVPEGASFSLGGIDREGIMETAQKTVEQIVNAKRQGVLMFPCASRYLMLAPGSEDEMQLVATMLGDTDIPYALAYSGGEICPVRGKDGKLHNRFHNFTFVACAF